MLAESYSYPPLEQQAREGSEEEEQPEENASEEGRERRRFAGGGRWEPGGNRPERLRRGFSPGGLVPGGRIEAALNLGGPRFDSAARAVQLLINPFGSMDGQAGL